MRNIEQIRCGNDAALRALEESAAWLRSVSAAASDKLSAIKAEIEQEIERVKAGEPVAPSDDAKLRERRDASLKFILKSHDKKPSASSDATSSVEEIGAPLSLPAYRLPRIVARAQAVTELNRSVHDRAIELMREIGFRTLTSIEVMKLYEECVRFVSALDKSTENESDI